MLPDITSATPIAESDAKKLLIIAEGFETRSLSWIEKQINEKLFDDAIICEYEDARVSKAREMREEVRKRTKCIPRTMKYNRFTPTAFEREFQSVLETVNDYDDIYIDITVMSKMLIMILFNKLKVCNKAIHIIYTEPESWSPTKEQYESAMSARNQGTAICLSSVGVGDIVKTPALSSIVMQNEPCVLIAFLSFNEQLVNMLIDEINPEKVVFINKGCTSTSWREEAIEKIHEAIIKKYHVKKDKELLKYELCDYKGVFEKIAEIYRYNWINNRLIISPTGYKLHAFSCALAKICCPDIHVEYPTPESYLFDGYSSDIIKFIHEIVFPNFRDDMTRLANIYKLNG